MRIQYFISRVIFYINLVILLTFFISNDNDFLYSDFGFLYNALDCVNLMSRPAVVLNSLVHHPLLMMMMNSFCGMVDQRKAFSLISSRDHCQRSSPSRISDTPRAGFEPAQNLSSALVE